MSVFTSRTGKLSCTPSEVFEFVTDIRNFRQFVPEGAEYELQIEQESCNFKIPPVGGVKIRLSEKTPFEKVVFSGNALISNDFVIILNITENNAGKADVNIEISAFMNPVLKMMAAKPLGSFLEQLIAEMEKFRNWDKTT